MPDVIELGKTGGEFPLWLATQAMAYANTKLNAQAATLQSLESRATSIMQWSVSATLGLIAFIATYKSVTFPAVISVITAAACLLAACLCLVGQIMPKEGWYVPGYSPAEFMDESMGSEFEVLDACARGLSDGINKNDQRLKTFGHRLTWAGYFFCSAPFGAGIVWLIATVVQFRKVIFS